MRSDPEVMKYAGNGEVQTKEDIEKFLVTTISYQEKYGHSMCSVFEKESGIFVGQAGLFHIGFYDKQPEIGYRLHKAFWGKGYATELTHALIKWGFEHLSVTKLVAFIHPENVASRRVLEKNDMNYMGIVNCYYGELAKYEIYKNDAIELVTYNPEWPKLADLEIKKLCEVLPSKHILDIQHVGSTAIPGLSAKPIIDIQIAVDSLFAIQQTAINILKSLGYEYWADNPDPERMFFVKGMPPFGDKRTHHVHIVEPASKHWQGKIQFRDYLKSHPEAVQEYEELKVALAKQHTYNRELYTNAKTEFVNSILNKIQSEMSINIRRTARAIILNPNNEVLLLKINDKPLHEKEHQSQKSFWVTVGGEVENNEPIEEALKRELREEVGIINTVQFALIAYGEHILPWKGLPTRFIEKFFIVHTESINLGDRDLTNDEVKVIGEYRWWSINDLLNTKEMIFPGCLAGLVADYIEHRNQWEPREISLD